MTICRCLVLIIFLVPVTVSADVYRWDTREMIPGTVGIEPGPGMDLTHLHLAYARLSQITPPLDLSNSNFESSNLSNARFSGSILANANFTDVNLHNAGFWRSDLTNAVFTNAIVTEASFRQARGFTKEQLYSTASYAAKQLSGINLSNHDLTGWHFSDQVLAGADISDSILVNADLAGADLRDAVLTGDLNTANLIGANLTNVRVGQSNLTNANLSNAIATNAFFESSIVTGANFSGARVVGADFSNAGFTTDQLYSTASYQDKTLVGIGLRRLNLSDVVLSGQDLQGADLTGAVLTNANLSESKLANAFLSANLTDADLTGSDLANAWLAFDIGGADLTRANLPNTRLTNARFGYSNLQDTVLRGADLTNANLQFTDLSSAKFNSETVYNQWTQFRDDFDPQKVGITLVQTAIGDFNADGVLDNMDVDLLSPRSFGCRKPPFCENYPRNWLAIEMFDVNVDTTVDAADLRYWVKDLKQTWFGDANLDGEFNSSDLVTVFQAGQYEDRSGNSNWNTGDWDGDGNFTTGDLVLAFQDGGYERGMREIARGVPEPGRLSGILWCVALLTIRLLRVKRTG